MHLSTVQTKGAIGKPWAQDTSPALWTGAFYLIGAEVGILMASAPVPITELRPGGAILLAAFLGTQARWWWRIVLAAFGAHLVVALHAGAPVAASLSWFVGNCTLALLGALGVGWFLRQRLRFDLLRHVLVFVWCGGFLAPAGAALLEVALLQATGGAHGGFWHAWTVRAVSSAAVLFTIVPLRVNWPAGIVKHLSAHSRPRQLEAALLVFALLAVGGGAFVRGIVPDQFVPLLTYAPLLLLFWTALRFGSFGAGLAFLLFALFVVLGTAHGVGPFATDTLAGSALLLPLFLLATAVPLLLLSAAVQERRGTLAALVLEQEKLGLALAAERKRAERLSRERHARAEVEQRVTGATVELRRANEALRVEIAARKQALEAERAAAAAQRLATAESQRQREELTHLSRVVVLGELSGALAHELNQPLAAILANAQAARRFLARPNADLGEIQEILDDIVQEDKRAGHVIRRLRALFKKGEPVLRPVAVAELLDEVVALTHGNLVERGIGVQLEPAAGLAVLGDRVQLQQVLLNLVINACDAMSMTAPARRCLRLGAVRLGGGAVRITVADSGPGIAAELAGKIFDPFFTTKPEGIGFGLSISRAIIAQHGGQIDAANLPEGGCVFSIRLPAYPGEK